MRAFPIILLFAIQLFLKPVNCESVNPVFPSYVEMVVDRNEPIVVEYNATLHCSLKSNFCTFLYYKEHDYLTTDDEFKFVSFHCTKTHNLTHHVKFNMTGGDGSDDFHYEPFIEVYHDCGPTVMTQNYFLPYVNMEKDYAFYDYYFNITDDGTYSFPMYYALRAEELKKDLKKKEEIEEWIKKSSFSNEKVEFAIINGPETD